MSWLDGWPQGSNQAIIGRTVLLVQILIINSVIFSIFWERRFTDEHFTGTLLTGRRPHARGHVFVLVALASHNKIAPRYFNGVSAACFRDFSLNKILITFRNVRGLPGTNFLGPSRVEQHSFDLSERVPISRTILRRKRFVVLWENEIENQNSAFKAAQGNLSGNS
jgi:hypothetical protein